MAAALLMVASGGARAQAVPDQSEPGSSAAVTLQQEPTVLDEEPVTLDGELAPETALPVPPAATASDSAVVAESAPVEADAPAGDKGGLSVLPALLAIIVALAFRQVIAALFAGVWLGAWIALGTPLGFFQAAFDAVDTYVLKTLANEDHAAILIFSLMVGGVVGLVQRNGGTAAIVERVVRFAHTARRGQLATALLGTAIFFDDYANTLIVGGTMRPITDRLRISREKLAYLVDSTAAPVACLALVTTWIGYEVGLIGDAIAKIPGYDESAYGVFLNSIPYSFYPILALFFVYAVTISRRDFGPMLAAERRARQTGALYRPDAVAAAGGADEAELAPPEGIPLRLMNAVVPILTLVVGVLVGLWITGRAGTLEAGDPLTLQNVVSNANSYNAMMWGSLAAVLVAVTMSIGQRILTLTEAVDAWYAGMRSMMLAVVILLLAWALGDVNNAIGTSDFLVGLLSDALAPGWVPAIVFVLAAATAFATGSSWGAMAILMPLVVPLAYGVLQADGLHTTGEFHHIIYSAVSAVLAGSVWGDHCSPISDTTILSSLASSCDHVDHVRTQLPYAFLVGGVALFLGTLPAGFGADWWWLLPIQAAILLAVLYVVGGSVDDPEVPA